MLKQTFDKEQLKKALTSADVWKWDVLNIYGDVDNAIGHTINYWKGTGLRLSPLKKGQAKSKEIFRAAIAEDDFAIRLLDRFIRRVYKVRQADRNRIVRQVVTLLKDPSDLHVIRLDIKSCYESIKFSKIIEKFEDDLILAPECIRLLKEIHEELVEKHNVDGLPRGLSISPTLAELFLERFDAKIALHPDVLYRARYVDDIVIFTTSIKNDKVKSDIDTLLNKMGLSLNDDKAKSYSGSTEGAAFDYLGYSFRVTPIKKGPNQVVVTISNAKLNKIKTRVVKSFSDYKKHNNISLLKRRLEYLSMLKTVKKGKNGHLLAGIAYNYRFVTDEFECLKPIDRFIRHQLNDPRFGIISPNKEIIFKVSFYSNVIKKIIGSFTKTQTNQIMRIWKNV